MKDPVCGMDVKPEQSKAKSEHHGQTYHFCSNECKQKFDKSPDSYAMKGGHQGQQAHAGQGAHGTQQPQGGQRQQQHQGGGQPHQAGGQSHQGGGQSHQGGGQQTSKKP